MTLTPLQKRRLKTFKSNRRAVISLKVFLFIFLITLTSEFWANDKPVFVWHQDQAYTPILFDYPETEFGGALLTTTNYQDPYVKELITQSGFMIWPLIPYHHSTILYNDIQSAPSAPNEANWLGTDDQGRDVMARLFYGTRISLLFTLILTGVSSIIGILIGALQGFIGGWFDLIGQRILEIWQGMPVLFLLIILSSLITPSFWSLLIIMVVFSWMSLVGLVRAEVLRTRNFDYVIAARALGVSEMTILFRHVLPNAMVATMTMVPFLITGGITLLTSLDFLGLGLPPGSASLGEMLAQGKNNLQAPWLGLTGFFSLAILLTLLTFIGEGIRDAFDPRHVLTGDKHD